MRKKKLNKITHFEIIYFVYYKYIIIILTSDGNWPGVEYWAFKKNGSLEISTGTPVTIANNIDYIYI